MCACTYLFMSSGNINSIASYANAAFFPSKLEAALRKTNNMQKLSTFRQQYCAGSPRKLRSIISDTSKSTFNVVRKDENTADIRYTFQFFELLVIQYYSK